MHALFLMDQCSLGVVAFLHAAQSPYAAAFAAAWLFVMGILRIDLHSVPPRLEMEYQLEGGAEYILNQSCAKLGQCVCYLLCVRGRVSATLYMQ